MKKENEQKTQSMSTKSNRNSKKSLVAAPTQRSQKSVKTQLTQKTTLGPPNEAKFDKMKSEALKIQKTQMTHLATSTKVRSFSGGFWSAC